MDSTAEGSTNWLRAPSSPSSSDRCNTKISSGGRTESPDSCCSTPKKMPAKEHFRKNTTDNQDAEDSYFLEFFERVKLAQEGSMSDAQTAEQSNTTKASRRQSPVPLSVLPDYARYQDHKLQRVLSRGNSLKDIMALTPRSSDRVSTSPPRVEWIPDRQSPRNLQRSWDEETLIARHAFPTSIFCKKSDSDHPNSASQGGRSYYPHQSLSNTSDLSDISLHGLSRTGSFRDSSCSSTPSAAALSGNSSSSMSEEEPQGIRQFLAFLERNPSFSNRSRQSYRSEASHAAMVEISPGVSEPLRRADETIHAVRNDFYVPVSCFSCSLDIFCIADAKYVVCPTCKVVSPIEEGALDGQKLVQHGLGLGFTCESLFEIQSEILSKRG